VIQFAVDMLKVKHIMVVGHYGCSGVRAVVRCDKVGLSDNWLRHVQDVKEKHSDCLCRLPDDIARSARLCEFNVIEQVDNVCKTSIVRDAWDRGQVVTVHGLIYGLKDGHLRNLKCSAASAADASVSYKTAVAALQSEV
jgi:carbonic anhydrase